MTCCDCPPTGLTRVQLGAGVALLRCSAHDTQTWLLDGRTSTAQEVLPLLRGVFAEHRGDGRGERRHPAVRTLPRRRPSAATRTPGGSTQEQLTALMHARGLSGTWAVA